MTMERKPVTRRPLTCEEVLERLSLYLDRELDDAAWAEIDRHLELCRGCFSRAEFERRLKVRVRGAGEQIAPASLRARIKELVKKF